MNKSEAIERVSSIFRGPEHSGPQESDESPYIYVGVIDGFARYKLASHALPDLYITYYGDDMYVITDWRSLSFPSVKLPRIHRTGYRPIAQSAADGIASTFIDLVTLRYDVERIHALEAIELDALDSWADSQCLPDDYVVNAASDVSTNDSFDLSLCD